MIPAGAVALDNVPGAIECVGLGRVITDADRYVGMEWASCCSPRRKQRRGDGGLQVVGVEGDGHQSLLLQDQHVAPKLLPRPRRPRIAAGPPRSPERKI